MGNKINLGLIAALAAAAAIAPAAQARRAADVTYGGPTSAKWPVMLQLSRDGRQVAYAVAAWTTQCTNGRFSDSEEFEHIPVRAGGNFTHSYDTGDYTEGSATVHFAASIDGKVSRNRTKITGTVRVMSSVKDAANGVDETCDTGTVKYVAVN
jgi:hypothetical protein